MRFKYILYALLCSTQLCGTTHETSFQKSVSSLLSYIVTTSTISHGQTTYEVMHHLTSLWYDTTTNSVRMAPETPTTGQQSIILAFSQYMTRNNLPEHMQNAYATFAEHCGMVRTQEANTTPISVKALTDIFRKNEESEHHVTISQQQYLQQKQQYQREKALRKQQERKERALLKQKKRQEHLETLQQQRERRRRSEAALKLRQQKRESMKNNAQSASQREAHAHQIQRERERNRRRREETQQLLLEQLAPKK